MTSLDLSVLGLPLHPLVVHLVVVALPVGALGTLAAVISPRVRARYGTLSLLALSVGAVAAIVARLSGEDLARSVTLPQQHATWGTALLAASLATAALGWLWWWLERRHAAARPGTGGFGGMAAGALLVPACLAVAGLTVLTGHTGAVAVWGAGAAAGPSAPGGGTASPQAPAVHTRAEVAQHADATSCWAIVDGGVYDLTPWIDRHPGGRQRILSLCGTDATEAFRTQHDDDARPNRQLEGMGIGVLP